MFGRRKLETTEVVEVADNGGYELHLRTVGTISSYCDAARAEPSQPYLTSALQSRALNPINSSDTAWCLRCVASLKKIEETAARKARS